MDRLSRMRRYREERERAREREDYARRKRRDMARREKRDMRERMYDMARRDKRYYPIEDYGYDIDMEDYNYDMRGRRDYGTRYPFMVSGEYGRYDDYPYGYNSGEKYSRDYKISNTYMDSIELSHLTEDLMSEIDEKDKPLLSREAIKKRTENLGMDFNHYSFDEFYAVVLMLFTDFSKTLGSANMDTYLKMAKDWLCDEDADVKYGEKLATYYDSVIMGE